MKIFVDGILRGRIAFVTGGGTGITAGVARALAEAGANVALVSRSIEHFDPMAGTINQARGQWCSSPPVREGVEPATTPRGAFAVHARVRNPHHIETASSAS